MAVNSIPNEISSEADVSMILNTLMYVNNFPTSADRQTVETLLCKQAGLFNDNKLDPEQKEAYQCVYQYIYGKKYDVNSDSNFQFEGKNCHPEIAQLNYLNHSDNYLNNNETNNVKDGAVGATFYSTDSSGNIKDVYVSYRGTGDGRWYDNGDAFSKKYSQYQQDAAEYFDHVMDSLGVTEDMNVYVTGHSKGGNQAQFVTLASKHAYLVDKCISMDGEGFSPEAIAYFKELYGEDFYNKQCKKLYAICGDNDYVNVLGNKVVPEDHTVYVKTPNDVYDLENSHALFNKEKGGGNLFDFSTGKFNECTDTQREAALFSKSMSDEIMKLPVEQRKAICRSLMSILEYAFFKMKVLNGEESSTNGVGLNGEVMTKEEFLIFAAYIDDIGDQLLHTDEGRALIDKAASELINEDMKNDINNIFNMSLIVLGGPLMNFLFKDKGADLLIYSLEIIIDRCTELVAQSANFIMAYEFFSSVRESIKKFLKETFDKDYKAAQEYLSNSSLLQFDTADLHDLAERLWKVNGRLEDLDHRLDDLYRNVKWSDLGKIIKVASADFKIGRSERINNCANCLNDTAGRFEAVEQEILNMLV